MFDGGRDAGRDQYEGEERVTSERVAPLHLWVGQPQSFLGFLEPYKQGNPLSNQFNNRDSAQSLLFDHIIFDKRMNKTVNVKHTHWPH